MTTPLQRSFSDRGGAGFEHRPGAQRAASEFNSPLSPTRTGPGHVTSTGPGAAVPAESRPGPAIGSAIRRLQPHRTARPDPGTPRLNPAPAGPSPRRHGRVRVSASKTRAARTLHGSRPGDTPRVRVISASGRGPDPDRYRLRRARLCLAVPSQLGDSDSCIDSDIRPSRAGYCRPARFSPPPSCLSPVPGQAAPSQPAIQRRADSVRHAALPPSVRRAARCPC